MTTTLYVAETDEANAIVSVWVKIKNAKTARAFNPTRHSFDPEEKAEFFGAHEAEIGRWIIAKKNR